MYRNYAPEQQRASFTGDSNPHDQDYYMNWAANPILLEYMW